MAAQKYTTSRETLGYRIAPGSEKKGPLREAIVLNTDACPVAIEACKCLLRESENDISCSLQMKIYSEDCLHAVGLEVGVYSVFNDLLATYAFVELLNTQPERPELIEATLDVSSEDLAMANTFTVFVRQVRLRNGSIWTFDLPSLGIATAELGLT